VKTLQYLTGKKLPHSGAVLLLKKRLAFGVILKSDSGGATRSGVEEKIRHIAPREIQKERKQ